MTHGAPRSCIRTGARGGVDPYHRLGIENTKIEIDENGFISVDDNLRTSVPGVWAIGFITGNTEGQIQEEAQRDSYNIFLPTTPNPTSGFLLFIPKSETRHLSMTVEEGLKMVVSGGIVTPEGRAPDSAPEPEGDLPEGGLPEGGMEESEPPRRSEIA